MSEKPFDFAPTHVHAEGDLYERMGAAIAALGNNVCTVELTAGQSLEVYRDREGRWFVTLPERWTERFEALPVPIFQKELSNEMVDKLRLQLMTVGMGLQSIRPGILNEIANLFEQRLANPGPILVSAIERRQVTAFIRLMRVAEKFMKAWALADAAFRIVDNKQVS